MDQSGAEILNPDLLLDESENRDSIHIVLGEAIDENELPGMHELWETVLKVEIPQERIDYLRLKYYPSLSHEEIVLIEHTIDYSFKKFQLYAKWTHDADNQQPGLEDFGLNATSPLQDRLEAIRKLSSDGRTNTAFASLEHTEAFLNIPGESGLIDLIDRSATLDQPYAVIEVGCGGQSTDIQLLTNDLLIKKDVRIVGVGAYDYGKELRKGFPELDTKLGFMSENIYLAELPESADLVFSVRTLPYTGVVDAVRFCDSVEGMCKPNGTVWIEGIEEHDFNFSGTEYKNLAEYLDKIKEKFPNLNYRKDDSIYAIRWIKGEKSPFADLEATSVIYNDRQQPHLIQYGLKPQPPPSFDNLEAKE